MQRQIPFLDADTIANLLPISDAIKLIDTALGVGIPQAPARTSMRTHGAELLLMPAASAAGVGVKLVTINDSNLNRGLPTLHSVYVLFDRVTSAPLAFLDGDHLTGLRTAALSGVATNRLAPKDASTLVIFGAGPQARFHFDAMRAIRPIETIRVVSRNVERAADLVEHIRRAGYDARLGSPSDVSSASIVCACTTSSTPVFVFEDLPSSWHVNAVGTHHPDRAEIDANTVRAARLWVDDLDAAEREAGDLLMAGVDMRQVDDLHALCRGPQSPVGAIGRTLYKGVGVAGEDLLVAAESYVRWADAP